MRRVLRGRAAVAAVTAAADRLALREAVALALGVAIRPDAGPAPVVVVRKMRRARPK